MTWVLDQRFEPTDLAVMMILANWANDDGYCWPGQTKILSKIDMSKRTLIRRLADLEERGFITRERRHRQGGQRTSDAYTILMTEQDAHLREGQGANLSPVTGGIDQVPTVAPTRDTSDEPSGTDLRGDVSLSQSSLIASRLRTDSKLSAVMLGVASRAGLTERGLQNIADCAREECNRDIGLTEALTLALAILDKAKTVPRAPVPYVTTAIRKTPFEVQKYIDEAGLGA